MRKPAGLKLIEALYAALEASRLAKVAISLGNPDLAYLHARKAAYQAREAIYAMQEIVKNEEIALCMSRGRLDQ